MTKPCAFCRSTKRERSACPLCGKVICRKCAERPYVFCCDEDIVQSVDRAKAALDERIAKASG